MRGGKGCVTTHTQGKDLNSAASDVGMSKIDSHHHPQRKYKSQGERDPGPTSILTSDFQPQNYRRMHLWDFCHFVLAVL